jgi:hypothetical protein
MCRNLCNKPPTGGVLFDAPFRKGKLFKRESLKKWGGGGCLFIYPQNDIVILFRKKKFCSEVNNV